jgi:hypothetical protein
MSIFKESEIKLRLANIEVLFLLLKNSAEDYYGNDEIPNKNASKTSIKSQIKILRHELTALKEEL